MIFFSLITQKKQMQNRPNFPVKTASSYFMNQLFLTVTTSPRTEYYVVLRSSSSLYKPAMINKLIYGKQKSIYTQDCNSSLMEADVPVHPKPKVSWASSTRKGHPREGRRGTPCHRTGKKRVKGKNAYIFEILPW